MRRAFTIYHRSVGVEGFTAASRGGAVYRSEDSGGWKVSSIVTKATCRGGLIASVRCRVRKSNDRATVLLFICWAGNTSAVSSSISRTKGRNIKGGGGVHFANFIAHLTIYTSQGSFSPLDVRTRTERETGLSPQCSGNESLSGSLLRSQKWTAVLGFFRWEKIGLSSRCMDSVTYTVRTVSTPFPIGTSYRDLSSGQTILPTRTQRNHQF